jgi:hypothetical protein
MIIQDTQAGVRKNIAGKSPSHMMIRAPQGTRMGRGQRFGDLQFSNLAPYSPRTIPNYHPFTYS